MHQRGMSTTASWIFIISMVEIFHMYIIHKGDVVRIQPNHLSFTSFKAIQDIHGFKGKSVKGELYDNLFRPPGAEAGQNMLASTLNCS